MEKHIEYECRIIPDHILAARNCTKPRLIGIISFGVKFASCASVPNSDREIPRNQFADATQFSLK